MNILFLNSYFQPESTPFTHLENDIITALIDDGNKIAVLTPKPTRNLPEGVECKHFKDAEILYNGKVKVRRFWAPAEGKNPIGRAFRYIWCNFRQYRLAIKYNNVDVIFANSTPPTQGYLAGRVKKKLSKLYGKAVPFVFDLQDIFPDSLVNAGMTKEGSFIWKIGREIEKKTYALADQIITISDGFKENLLKKGVKVSKIIVIPNWINTEEVQPVDRQNNKLFDKYNLDRNLFYICYSGNIGHSQNFELLLEVAKKCQTEFKDVHFVLIGNGAAKEELEQQIKNQKICNIIMLPFQPYEDISEVFSLGDVGLIISKPGIGGSSVPSKTWSIMAAERPILASFDGDSELAKIIKNEQCGFVAEAGSEDELLSSIKEAYNRKNILSNIGEKARDFIEINLSAKTCLNNYLNVFRNIGD